MVNTKALEKTLREAREAAGLTQDDLAASVGVTRAAVSLWETGDRNPGGPARRLIAQALDLPLDAVDRMFDGADGNEKDACGGGNQSQQAGALVAVGGEG